MTLDYCENSDLFEFISKYQRNQNSTGMVSTQGQGMLVRDLPLLKKLYLQLIEGISALHKAEYAHMDIKLENIVVDEELFRARQAVQKIRAAMDGRSDSKEIAAGV